MAASEFDPHALLAESRLGVLATIKSSGLPQLSPVTPFYDRTAGVIYVSMTEGRAKTANLRRDPRAAIEVTSSDGWAWATAEGPVTLTGPAQTRTDPRSRRWWTTTAAPRANTRTGRITGLVAAHVRSGSQRSV
jgi:PPOX class probable F420-dependent enzyme